MVSKKSGNKQSNIWLTCQCLQHGLLALLYRLTHIIFGTASMRMPMGGLHYQLRIFQAAGVAVISLRDLKIARGDGKHLKCFTNTHTIGEILCSHVGCRRTILFLKR
jgi:hypothetical protein